MADKGGKKLDKQQKNCGNSGQKVDKSSINTDKLQTTPKNGGHSWKNGGQKRKNDGQRQTKVVQILNQWQKKGRQIAGEKNSTHR